MPERSPEILRAPSISLIAESLEWWPRTRLCDCGWIEWATSDVLAVGEGTSYPAVHWLEERGWIEASWGLSENIR